MKTFKNIIAIFAFAVFVAFFVKSYNERTATFELQKQEEESIKQEEEQVDAKVEEVANEPETEDRFANNGVLDPYYTEKNINIENILTADDDDNRQMLVGYLNRFVNEDFREIYGPERVKYIKLYEGFKIIGDSNVEHFKMDMLLETKFLGAFPGYSLTKQIPRVKEVLEPDTKVCILWNGYNIAYYKDADEFVAEYQKLVDTIHEYNPKIEVFVCSLLPTTQEAIDEDLHAEFVHKLYKGKEYDRALEKHFGKNNRYINTRFLVKQHYYGNDGVHFLPPFYHMLLPYFAYYINLHYDGVKLYEVNKTGD